MADKIPRVLKVKPVGYLTDCYSVYITAHQCMKLPAWVRRMVTWHPDYNDRTDRHVYVVIYAVDEMQAFVRFQQLWIGLPKE